MAKFNKKDFTLVPSRQARIGMPANQQVVYMWLSEHSDDNNQSFPSRKVLAYECGMSPSTLDRSIHELEKEGFIVRENRYKENKQVSNLYTVLIVTKGIQNEEGGVFNMTSPPIHIDEQNPTHRTQPNKNLEISKDISLSSSDDPKFKREQFFYLLVKALGFSETTKFTAGREAKLRKRGKAFKASEILRAATNLGADAYMQGENDTGKRWGTIDYLLRCDENIDKYLQVAEIKFTEGAF